MQLLFTAEEMKLVAEILEEQVSAGEARTKARAYTLLDRVIAHDLRLAIDELEDLQEALTEYKQAFHQKLIVAVPETIPALAKRESLLERLMDKVTEACAMV